MSICDITGFACDCQPDAGLPCTATLENVVKTMHGWRTACLEAQKQLKDQPAPQGVAEVMGLVGDYAEERRRCGSHVYNTTSLAARGRVEQALTAIVQERDVLKAEADQAAAIKLRVDALGGTISRLHDRISGLDGDTAALDWLELQINQKGAIHLHDGKHPHGSGLGLRSGYMNRTLRQAIDAARGSKK